MHRLSTVIVLFFATASLAQSPAIPTTNAKASAVILRSIPTGTDCPVGFRANRQSNAQILSADDADKDGPALGLHLILDRPASSNIESVEVTVYGTSPKTRSLPTNFQPADANTRDTVSKSFLLQRSASDKTLSNADVWVHNV